MIYKPVRLDNVAVSNNMRNRDECMRVPADDSEQLAQGDGREERPTLHASL